MTITIDPRFEARLRERAGAEGITVAAYLERLVDSEQVAEQELETLALEGLNSGAAFEVGAGYWEEKHRLLDERIQRTGAK